MNLGFLDLLRERDLDRERFRERFRWNLDFLNFLFRNILFAPFIGLHNHLDHKIGPLSSWKLVNG